MKLLLSILYFILLPLTMQGQETIHGVCGLYGDNVLWDLKGDTLFINGKGDMMNYEWSGMDNRLAPWKAYRAQIKCVVIEDSVTSIGEYALAFCEKLTSVSLPQSMRTVCEGAFWECSSLEAIVIPDSVSIGGNAFYSCISLRSVTFSEHLLELGRGAFSKCASLDSVCIPNSIKTIDATFDRCTSLKYVYIPSSITSIGGLVFNGCESLHSVVIPNSVKTMGGSVFKDCIALDSITIPNSVTSMAERVFEDCTNLKFAKLSEKLTGIPKYTFKNCTNLNSVEIPEGVTSIEDGAFYGCEHLSSVIISKNVTYIGWSAFYNCWGIEDVFCYPTTMPWTAPDAFSNYMYWPLQATLHVPKKLMGTYSVTEAWTTFERLVALPDAIDQENNSTVYYTFNEDGTTVSVTSGQGKYEASVVVPNRILSNGQYYNVASVENFAFFNCGKLTSVSLSNTIKYVGRFAFADCSGLEKVKLPTSITAIEDYTFSNCASLLEIDIPGNVSSIGEGAFVGCSSLQDISLPNKTTSIGMRAFADCKALATVNLSSRLSVIDDNAFENCKSLTSVKIPNSMTLVGSNAFKDCTALKEVIFDGCTGEICQDAFNGCTGLKDIYSYSDVPPAADEYAFEGSNYDATLHVAAASLEAYQTTAPWCYFKHIISHEEGAYGGIVFQYDYNHEDQTATLVKVTISENTHEEKLVIPAEVQVEGKTYKVTEIERWALDYIWGGNITSIEFPSTLRELYTSVTVTSTLKTVKFMGDIEKIGIYTFTSALSNNLGPIESCFLNDFYCYASFVPELSPLAMNGGSTGLSRTASDDDIAEIELYERTYYLPRYFTYAWSDYEGNWHQETRYQYYLIEHATLHVPANLVESYKQTFPWNMFGNIVALTEEDYPEGIEELIHNSQCIMHNNAMYNLQGQRINSLRKGLNIVDGRKIWVK